MSSQLIVKSVRNFRNALSTSFNRRRGREYIPTTRELAIETSAVCNLDCCFCAYGKKQTAKVTMPHDLFESCVQQALVLGYDTFDLTPCTGDVFMDRGLFDKLAFLDRTPAVRSYGFITNFTVPRRQDIDRLVHLKKLSSIGISIYGHDLATFRLITRSNDKLYRRLVSNIDHLYDITRATKFAVAFHIHPGARSLRGRKSEVLDAIERFKKTGVSARQNKGLYNNWGGYITAEDVKGLPIEVGAPDMIYKNGACVRLFTTLQVTASGIVNGCACRDSDATLRLGDLRQTPLREIISSRNPAYMDLIEEQQRGEFRPVCKSCDFYSSIYHKSGSYKHRRLQSLDEFKAAIDRA
jgi:MoaA/NifB/PqqE/SkfB family radical SAM enzyme